MQRLKSLATYVAFLLAGLAIGWSILNLPALFKSNSIQGDYSAYYTGTSAQVVMYSTSTCPYCAKAREFFAARNIAYVEKDIQADPTALQQLKQLGATGVPQILIGDRRVPGFAPKAMEEALARLKSTGGSLKH